MSTASRAAAPAVEGNGARRAHTVERRPGLPRGRAVVGALLMTLAAVGVFVAYTGATEPPSDSLVVAARTLRVGDTVTASDVRVERGDLPDGVAGTFASLDDVVGRLVLAPIGEGELLQAGTLSDDVAPPPGREVAIALPRAQVAVGRLKVGELVDVYATTDEGTDAVVRAAPVVQIGEGGGETLTSARELLLVVSVPSDDAVTDLVHALRTAEVTVVRSTSARVTAARDGTDG